MKRYPSLFPPMFPLIKCQALPGSSLTVPLPKGTMGNLHPITINVMQKIE